jgi:glycosyltransferase involved in cell wall biosynthesis
VPAAALDTSVVVCAYTEDRWEELTACIASIHEQTVPLAEVIVVVDHNPSLLARAASELPGVHAVENRHSPGLRGARNSGVATARGDIVAFIDDDAVASADWLEQILLTYADPMALGVGGAIEPVFESGRAAWFPSEFDWVVGCTYTGMPEETSAVRNLIGCNMSFKRFVFDEVGGFRMGYSCDETEFCLRVARRWPEYRFVYNPSVRVKHHVPAKRMSWRYLVWRCYFEGGSKAVVAWLAGAERGLASERAYTMRTLPKGVIRGARDTLFRGDVAGLARSGAIMLGLGATVAGYLLGKRSTIESARKRGWTEQASVVTG